MTVDPGMFAASDVEPVASSRPLRAIARQVARRMWRIPACSVLAVVGALVASNAGAVVGVLLADPLPSDPSELSGLTMVGIGLAILVFTAAAGAVVWTGVWALAGPRVPSASGWRYLGVAALHVPWLVFLGAHASLLAEVAQAERVVLPAVAWVVGRAAVSPLSLATAAVSSGVSRAGWWSGWMARLPLAALGHVALAVPVAAVIVAHGVWGQAEDSVVTRILLPILGALVALAMAGPSAVFLRALWDDDAEDA